MLFHRLTKPVLTLAFMFAWSHCSSAANGKDDGTESDGEALVKRVLDRPSQLHQIDMSVRVCVGGDVNDCKGAGILEMRVAVDQELWALHWLVGQRETVPHNYDVCRSDGLFAFGSNPEKALHAHTLLIEKPRRFQQPDQPWTLCTDFGGIWHAQLRSYLARKRIPAVITGSTNVSDVRCFVVEIPIPASDVLDAFLSVRNRQLLQGGAVLRMFIAPEFGYAVPRYEYLGKEGLIDRTFSCEAFVEYPGHFFFPQSARIEYGRSTTQRGRPRTLLMAEVTKVHSLNEPVDTKLFDVSVPADTVVTDARKEVPIRAVLPESTRLDEQAFSDWRNKELARLNGVPSSRWSYRQVLVVSFSVVLLAAIGTSCWLLRK